MLTKRAVSWSVCASPYVCDSSHSTEWCLWCFAIWSILNGITGKWCGLLCDTDSLQSCASVFSEWNSSIMLLSTNSQPYVGKIREVTMLLRNQTHTVCCSTSHLSCHLKNNNTQTDIPHELNHCEVVTGWAYKFYCWKQTSISVLQCQNKPQTPIKAFTYGNTTRNKVITNLTNVMRNWKYATKLK